MQHYKAISRDTGVYSFESGKNYIDVQFRDGSVYRYDHVVTGKDHIEKMKRLAVKGKGLTTYINQHVRNRYAAKLR